MSYHIGIMEQMCFILFFSNYTFIFPYFPYFWQDVFKSVCCRCVVCRNELKALRYLLKQYWKWKWRKLFAKLAKWICKIMFIAPRHKIVSKAISVQILIDSIDHILHNTIKVVQFFMLCFKVYCQFIYWNSILLNPLL